LKTLIVHFLPRGELSHTKQLLDAFREMLIDGETQTVDLTQTLPDFFNRDNLSAYIKRNYLGQTLTPEEQQLMSRMDGMATQIRDADRVVVAFPMYNFSQPAIIKAYFDSVMQKGVTWNVTDAGYEGLMSGKSACVLIAAGGKYEGELKAMEHAGSLTETQLRFMGFSDIDVIMAAGVNLGDAGTVIEEGRKRVAAVARKWNEHAEAEQEPGTGAQRNVA
jgi:FMN-dependent NADH-azoreductase